MSSDSVKPTQFERLSLAHSSGNLTVGHSDLPNRDADYIIAGGIAGQRNRIGGAMMRMADAPTSGSAIVALKAVLSLVKHLAHVRNWRLSGRATQRVAEESLLHHLAPACPHCHGRKFEVVVGSNRLGGKACKPCHGTGMRALSVRHGSQVFVVLSELQAIETVVERAVGKLMR